VGRLYGSKIISNYRMLIIDPPAIAGGTDLFQAEPVPPGLVAAINRCQPTREASNSSSARGSHLPHKYLRNGRWATFTSTPSKEDNSVRASDLL